jgi:hypothetical protein
LIDIKDSEMEISHGMLPELEGVLTPQDMDIFEKQKRIRDRETVLNRMQVKSI